MDELNSQPEIDFLILADRAEAVGGKLYMMGGAWDQLGVVDFAQPSVFSIAIGILVPWNATNQQHNLELELQNADGQPLASMGANFVAGRPPTIHHGSNQRLVMAINGLFMLPGPGTYVVVGLINGHESRRTSFSADAVSSAAWPPQQAPGDAE